MKKNQSFHDGARAERSCIIRKIKAMMGDDADNLDPSVLLDWIRARHSRYAKRAGGL